MNAGALFVSAFSDLAPLPTYECNRAEFGPVTATGSEPYWAHAAEMSLVEAIRGGAPEQGTTVRGLWAASGLRLLYDAVDIDPWATLTERDGPLYTEEVVEVFIDPVGDSLSYFEIEVNPLNTVLDLVLRRNRSGYVKNFAWYCEGLTTAVSLYQGGWRAEMDIPFRALIADAPEAGTEWRVNFLRIDRPRARERELSAWSPPLAETFHVPQRFGTLRFG